MAPTALRSNHWPRRTFLKGLAVAAAGLSWPAPAEEKPAPASGIKLGLDNFAVRGMKWKADQLIDYAAQLKTDSLFITDLDAFENLSESYLQSLRRKAAGHELQI